MLVVMTSSDLMLHFSKRFEDLTRLGMEIPVLNEINSLISKNTAGHITRLKFPLIKYMKCIEQRNTHTDNSTLEGQLGSWTI